MMPRAGVGLLLLILTGRTAAQVRTVAVDETTVPYALRVLKPKHVLFDSLIVTQLKAAGLTIVGPESTQALWLKVRDSIGGYYDPYTGRFIQEKYQTVWNATLTALRQTYHIDAWIRPGVHQAQAHFYGSKVKWDGVEEESGGSGGVVGFIFGTNYGTLPALSLQVLVVDTAGKFLYGAAGGIQLASNVHGDLPPDSLLQDSARIRRAVHLAVDSLPAALLRIKH